MGFPGDQDARSPRSWQRPGSGYLPAGPLRRDPVRGFPPTPGARDTEYASAQAASLNGSGGTYSGANGGFGAGAAGPGHDGDVRTADGPRPGITADGPRPGIEVSAAHNSATAAPRGAKAWNTNWGGGPWTTGTGGGLWPAGAGNGSGIGGFAGSTGAPTWTYGEDEPTETWTLRAADTDTRPGAARRDDFWGAQEETGEFGAVDRAPALAAPAAPTAPAGGRRRGSPGRRGRGAGHGMRREAGALSSQDLPAGKRPEENAATAGAASARSRRRLRGGHVRIVVATTLAVIAAAGAASAAAFALTKHGHVPAANTTQASVRPSLASTPSPQPLGKWKHIETRADDPIPLTLAELFPARVNAGVRNYAQTAQSESTNCKKAVFGARLKAAVRKGCSQALRASYLSSNHRRMGTIGVLNLATSAAAAKLGKIVAAPRQFIEPLPADHGPTRNMGKGNGLVWAVAKGHYLILMWVQYANLQSPATSAERRNLMQFVNDLYQKTANQSLTGRMVTGKPLTP
jgi:hypothetical protein